MSAENLLLAVLMRYGIQVARQQVKDSHPIPAYAVLPLEGKTKEKCCVGTLPRATQRKFAGPFRGERQKERIAPFFGAKAGRIGGRRK